MFSLRFIDSAYRVFRIITTVSCVLVAFGVDIHVFIARPVLRC